MTEKDAVPAQKAALWEDFIDVFLSPAELFRRRADGRFGLALLVFVILGALLYFGTRAAMSTIMDAEFERGMAAVLKSNPGMTAEQMASGRKVAETFGAAFVVIGAPIAALLLGLAIWVSSKLVDAKLGYRQATTVATYSLFARLPESLVSATQATFMEPSSITSRFSVSLGLGRFLDPDQTNAVVMAFAGRLDLFTLWVTVLIAIGIKVIGKVSVGQAALGATTVWLLGALPALLQAWRST